MGPWASAGPLVGRAESWGLWLKGLGGLSVGVSPLVSWAKAQWVPGLVPGQWQARPGLWLQDQGSPRIGVSSFVDGAGSDEILGVPGVVPGQWWVGPGPGPFGKQGQVPGQLGALEVLRSLTFCWVRLCPHPASCLAWYIPLLVLTGWSAGLGPGVAGCIARGAQALVQGSRWMGLVEGDWLQSPGWSWG